jgi:KDO2-lipid IV(A) lauroyltransferase
VGSILVYLGYSALWRLVRILPEKAAENLFGLIAKSAYLRNKKRVQRLRENYRKVAPGLSERSLEELVENGLVSAMRYWCETFRISDWRRDRIINSVKSENEKLLLDAIEQRTGLIVALPHAGNWDHAGLYFCTKGITVNTVAEHLKPERLFRKFLKHREQMGMNVLDLNESVMPELEKILRNGGLVALVSDRDLSKNGIKVRFFDATAKMPAGPALLALKTGAPLITAYVSFTEDGIKIKFSGPFKLAVNSESDFSRSVQELTQLLADQFALDIASDPASWHMQQRIFIDDLSNSS